MTDYLDRLEHDLVAAFERQARAGRPRRLWYRTRALPFANGLAGSVVAIALAAVIAVMVLPREAAVPPEPSQTVPAQPGPLPPGTRLSLSGDVVRGEGGTLWRGAADGPGGRGGLLLTGRVTFAAGSQQTIRFSWTSERGRLDGCADLTILRRPHGRWLWDASARITVATDSLARFAGRNVDFAGSTPVSDTSRAHIGINASSRPPPTC